MKKQPENILILYAHLVILVYYIPYFLMGENAHILIHDNLDSNIVWVKILLDNNAVFAHPSKVIDSVMNGLPVFSIYGTYDIPLLIFKTFGIYFGYVINKLLISIIGFWGMFLLLRKHFLSFPYSPYILVGTSLVFALLPFWSFSATVLGLPFVLFAFLNLRNKNDKFYNWLIIIIFAFYSSLILSGIFLLLLLAVVFLHDIIKHRKFNWYFFYGLVLLSIAYIISHFPLFFGFFKGNFESNRTEFYSSAVDFKTALHNSLSIFLRGVQPHAKSLHMFIVIPVFFIFIVWYKSFNKTIKLILIFIIITSIFFGFQRYYIIKPIVDQIRDIVPIQLQRFHFLHPMFWYVLLAVSLSLVTIKIKYGEKIAVLLLIFQLAIMFNSHEIWKNRNLATFKEFYSEATFTKIKNTIAKPIDSYRVISVGIHPSVAQYNGFYTLDGYLPNYPLKYKHEFRKVIANELARDEQTRKYFDNWGNRCYAFSTEIGKKRGENINHIDYLEYDFQYLRKMGGKYIFSKAYINESLNPEIKLIDVVNSLNNHYKIYVYEIQETQQNK